MKPSAGQPPAPSGASPRWGLGDAALGMFLALLMTGVAASLWMGATGDTEHDLGTQALGAVGLWTGLAGVPLWASRHKGSGRLAVDFGLCMRAVDVPIGLAVGIGGQLFLHLIIFLLSPLIGELDTGPATDLVRETQGPGLVGAILFIVVGAAVVEELFFRGLLLRSLQRRLSTVLSVSLSALLFGFAHLAPLGVVSLIVVITSLVAFGAVLAVLAVRTGRLGASIWAHAAFNAFTAVVLVLE